MIGALLRGGHADAPRETSTSASPRGRGRRASGCRARRRRRSRTNAAIGRRRPASATARLRPVAGLAARRAGVAGAVAAGVRAGTSSARRSAATSAIVAIDGGGGDLIFLHHEAEIAQAEGASGETFVGTGCTLHAPRRRREDEQVVGNLVFVGDLLRSNSGDAIRDYLIANDYRAEADFVEADSRPPRSSPPGRDRPAAAPRSPSARARAADPRAASRGGQDRARFLAATDDDLDTAAAPRSSMPSRRSR